MVTSMISSQGLVPRRLFSEGKVRDTYALNIEDLLMVATDRISAFDMVLPVGIPEKGVVLNNISAFWFDQTRHIVPNHLIALAKNLGISSMGRKDSPPYLGMVASLPDEVVQRAMIVSRANRVDIECIARGYITGSAWSEYCRFGTVSGKSIRAGLVEGDKFPEILFTPTTKAEEGHDQNMTDQEVVDMVGEDVARQLRELTIAVYQFAHDFALGKDIIIADTKMEFGWIGDGLALIDELLTPDSSRFWDAAEYQPGRSQPNFDKQFVRDWLTTEGWNREPPAPALPDDVVAQTTERYLEAYYRLTGEKIGV